MAEEFKKRTWHYVQKPYEYEITCDKCGGIDIEWSEFEGKIWCYSCEIDTRGTEGVFGGPIPIGCATILGMSFDRWDMEKKRVLTYDEEKSQYVPRKIKDQLINLARNGYEDITLSERDLVELIKQCSADFPLLIDRKEDKKMWLHINNSSKKILVETDIGAENPVELIIGETEK